MLQARYTKHPTEIKDYVLDFDDLCATDPASSYWVTADDGIAILLDSRTGNKVTVRGAGGLNGRAYKVAVDVQTVAGLDHRKEILVRVRGTGVVEGLPIDDGFPDSLTTTTPVDDGTP